MFLYDDTTWLQERTNDLDGWNLAAVCCMAVVGYINVVMLLSTILQTQTSIEQLFFAKYSLNSIQSVTQTKPTRTDTGQIYIELITVYEWDGRAHIK